MTRRRLTLGLLLPALLVALLVADLVAPPAASAAEGDRMVVETIAPGSNDGLTRWMTEYPLAVAALASDNRVVLTSWSDTTLIDLAGTTKPAAGTYSLGPTSASHRVLGLCGAPQRGELRINDIAFEGTTVTRLVASVGVRCSHDATQSAWVSATIRIGSEAPFSEVRPTPVFAPSTGQGTPSTVTATLENNGTSPTGVLGAATLDPVWPSAPDFTVVDDRCAGRVLALGDACTLGIRFLRSTGGTSLAWVKVPDTSAPGGVVVAPVAGTAIGAPLAPAEVDPFPVVGGVGVSWGRAESGFRPLGFRVERRQGDSWADVSGPLDAQTWSWVDETVAAGQSATYRVRGVNEGGTSVPSTEVTTARPAQDAVAGSVSAFSVDADYGGRQELTGGSDTAVSQDVQEELSTSSGGAVYSRQLRAPGGLSIGLPHFIPGPGVYPVGAEPVGSTDRLSVPLVSTGWCGDPTGTLTVEAVAYGRDRQLDVLTAHYELACSDGFPFHGELRLHSQRALSAVSVAPTRVDAGAVPVGSSSEPARVKVLNTGTAPQAVGAPVFTGPASADWRVVSNGCPTSLSAGEECAIDVVVTPTRSGARAAALEVPDSTLRGAHHAALTANGTSVPGAPVDVRALTMPQGGGVDVSWNMPEDTGGGVVSGYVVHRTVGTDVQTTRVGPAYWTDPAPIAGATYAVSAVTGIGEGPTSPATASQSRTDYLFLNTASDYGRPIRASFLALPDGTQAITVPDRPDVSVTVQGATTSPDGRQLLTSRNAAGQDTGWVVMRQLVEGSGEPTVLLRSVTGRPGQPAWSPDGRRVAVALYDQWSALPTLHVLDASTGAILLTLPRLEHPAWHPDSRTLFVVDHSLQARPVIRVDATSGARLVAYAGLDGTSALSTSPDGRWLAALRYADDRNLVSLLPVGGGAIREVPQSGGSRDLAWSPDGRRLLTTQNPPMGQNGVATSTIADSGEASAPVFLALAPFTLVSRATWVGRSVSIAPTPAVLGPSSTFAIDSTSLPVGTSLTCAVDTAPFVPCSSTYRPTVGSGAHLLRVRATEPDGRASVAARAFTLDMAGPTVRLTAPTVLATTSTTVLVVYSGTDTTGVASYDVRYRRASFSGSFGGYATAQGGIAVTNIRVALAAGYQYCFSVRGRDPLGNVSAWTAERCTARVLDDRSLTRSSSAWVRATGTAYYGSTLTTTTTKAVSLTRTGVKARQVFVLATTCPTCGSVAVYVGATKVGTLSLTSSTTRNRVLLSTTLSSARTGTLKLVTTSSNGRAVRVDAFAIRSW